MQELLRCQVREEARRLEDPSLTIIDTQSVRAAAGVPRATTGLDANKKLSGRKRGLAVDVLGLIIGLVVLAASAHDNAAGAALLDQAAERCGNRLEKALADQGFKDQVAIDGALLDIGVEVVRRSPDDQGQGFVPQLRRWIVEQVNGSLILHCRTGPRVRPPPRHLRLACPLGIYREHGPPPHHTESGLARHPQAGRVNITELLAGLQAQHDETTTLAAELRIQVEHLTATLAETEARLAELATTRKVIAELAPTGCGGEADPPEPTAAHQAIVNAFNEHPGRACRARELHELLGMPTDEASVNVTRARLGRLTRQSFLTQPGRGRYQKQAARSPTG